MAESEYRLYEPDTPTVTGFERELIEDVSNDEPWALVDRFSELHRMSGTEDERRAAAYLTDRLTSFDVPFDRYDPELWISQPHDASLRTHSPRQAYFDEEDGRPCVKTVSFSNDGTVTGEAVVIHRSNVEVMAEIAEDIDRDIAGKVVIFETVGLSIEALEQLQAAGAAATVLIHPHPHEPHSGIATPVWGGVPHPDHQHRVPDMTIVTVSRSVGDRLLEMADQDEPLKLELSAELTTDWFECPIVVARIPGEADAGQDDFVLAHAHYDSWYYGVTDNATGNASLLECARLFGKHRSRLKRDLWLAWWPAHSTGRYAGSTWFADEFALDLERNCIAHVNMDSPGVEDATEFQNMLVWMSEADSLCGGAIRDVCGKPSTRNRPRRAGDYSFNNLGISGMFALMSNIPKAVREERGYHPVRGSGGNSDAWHLSSDTLEKADPDVLIRDIRVYATVLVRLLNAESIPLDFRDTIEDHHRIVSGYAEEAGGHFDFDPVLTELSTLSGELEAFYGAIDEGTVEPSVANRTIRRLSRQLVRVNYVTEGPFEQDPAMHRSPYPSLEPATRLPELSEEEYRFHQWSLRRARNSVINHLETAIRILRH